MKRESQSSYTASKTYYGLKPNIDNNSRPEGSSANNNLSGALNSSWKPIKSSLATVVSPNMKDMKDIKDKAGVFKSPKYINLSKNESALKATTFYNRIDNNEKPL